MHRKKKNFWVIPRGEDLMHRTWFILLICGFMTLCAGLAAQTPEWLWVQRAGSTGEDLVSSMAKDSSGNIYATGSFSYGLDFPGATLSGSYKDMFVLKMGPEGNVIWMAKAIGTGDKAGTDVAVDGAGNVYVTGYFQGTAVFGAVTLTSASDLFVGKLDPNGNWLWASQATAISGGIDVDGDQNVYITGSFYGPSTFGDITVNSQNWDIFAAKLYNNGVWAWVHTAGGVNGGEGGNKIAVNSLGNGAIAGLVQPGALFGGIPVSSSGAFVAFFDQDGWTHVNTTENAEATDIVLGGYLGEIYVCGFFQNTSSFGGMFPQTSTGDWEAFVACMDASGSWIWSARGGGVYNDKAFAIDRDGSGNIYVTGHYGGSATFGSVPIPGVENNMFAAKLNSLGEWQWIQHGGGYAGAWSKALAVDEWGYCYAGGTFLGTVAFDDIVITYNGWSDVFLGKLGSGTAVCEDLLPSATVSLSAPCPNPLKTGETANLKARIAPGETGFLSVCNLRGQLIAERLLASGEHQLSLESQSWPAGIYLCRLRTQSANAARKLILLK